MTISPYQWRAYIGPRFEPAGAYTYDYVTNLPADPFSVRANLAANLTDGATTASVDSAIAFPTIGGLWIGPNGTGQAWEYVSYSNRSSNSFTGLVREPSTTREHNGIHTAGATVAQWWELTKNDGRFHITEQLDPSLATITWTAEIGGFYAPPAAIRPNHLILIQYHATPSAAWQTYALGFLDQPRIRDDFQKQSKWTLRIISLAGLIGGYTSKPVRTGDLNLAPAGSAKSSTPLADPYKEIQSGDFTAADPDLGAESAIDEDPATLWIAEGMRGSTPDRSYPKTGSVLRPGRFICTARIARWPGEPKGYRWLEFMAPDAAWPNQIYSGDVCNKTAASAAHVNFNGISMSPGQILALVENETLYKEANPLANPLAIFELGSYYFDSLDLAGDAIAVYGGEWFPTLAWGTGGTPARPLGGGYGTTWTSNTVAAPAPGQIIRYAYNSAATLDKHYFITDYVDMGGYTPANTDDPWIQLDLPRLGLALRDDITASSPGAGGKLYINKGDAGCTEGLLATGTIQIGLEQISYSARSTDSVTVSARGTGGTTAAAHKAADLVRVVDTDGTATEGYLVSRISWQRHGKSPYPSEFRIRRSNGDSARVPEDNNHDQDYEQLVYVSGYTQADYEATLSPSRRTTIIIIEIDRMNIDPSRPRINTIKAIADAAQFDSSQVLPDGTTAGDLIARILANAGAASNTIIVEAGTVDVGDLTTAAGDSAWSVAADVAAKSATLIDAERGGTIRIKANTLPAGTLSATYAVTNVVAGQVELAQASAKPYGQAKLPYILPDGTKGTAYYPSSIAFAAAPILELAEARYATAGAATIAVKRAYIMAKYPTQFVVELAEPNLALRPGTVASFAWQFASDMQPVSRIGIVMAADHEILAGHATTVLTIAQVDREAAG